MGADVDEDIGILDLVEPVVGGQVLVGRRALWIVENLADRAVAP